MKCKSKLCERHCPLFLFQGVTIMTEVEQKKWAFQKFTYCYEKLYGTRQRWRLNGGLQQQQHLLLKFLRKAKKEVPPIKKPEVVKSLLRDMVILPEMVGSMVGMYNGKTFNQVEINLRWLVITWASSPSPTSPVNLAYLILEPCTPPSLNPSSSCGQEDSCL